MDFNIKVPKMLHTSEINTDVFIKSTLFYFIFFQCFYPSYWENPFFLSLKNLLPYILFQIKLFLGIT